MEIEAAESQALRGRQSAVVKVPVTEWSLYVQVVTMQAVWCAAYVCQWGLRYVWAYAYIMYERLNHWRPTMEPDPAPCTGDILCARENVRHKRDCLGKPERINALLRNVGR